MQKNWRARDAKRAKNILGGGVKILAVCAVAHPLLPPRILEPCMSAEEIKA